MNGQRHAGTRQNGRDFSEQDVRRNDDNGPGIPAETVGIRDFSVRVSSREAHASLARGAQGNALKSIVAMAFALDGAKASM